MSTVERFANEAVRVLQFSTNDAVHYIQRNARVSEATARAALQAEITGYKA